MNKELNEEQRKLAYAQILEHFGVNAQLNKAVEEMLELCTIIMQRINKPNYETDNLIDDIFTDINFKEELADVNIMLAQLNMYQEALSLDKAIEYAGEGTSSEDWFYEISTNSVTDFKINRTLSRIEQEKEMEK